MKEIKKLHETLTVSAKPLSKIEFGIMYSTDTMKEDEPMRCWDKDGKRIPCKTVMHCTYDLVTKELTKETDNVIKNILVEEHMGADGKLESLIIGVEFESVAPYKDNPNALWKRGESFEYNLRKKEIRYVGDGQLGLIIYKFTIDF